MVKTLIISSLATECMSFMCQKQRVEARLQCKDCLQRPTATKKNQSTEQDGREKENADLHLENQKLRRRNKEIEQENSELNDRRQTVVTELQTKLKAQKSELVLLHELHADYERTIAVLQKKLKTRGD